MVRVGECWNARPGRVHTGSGSLAQQPQALGIGSLQEDCILWKGVASPVVSWEGACLGPTRVGNGEGKARNPLPIPWTWALEVA